MFECDLSERKSVHKTFPHLGPLRTLTSKDKSKSRIIDILFPGYECSFVKAGTLCDYIAPMKMTTSSFGQSIG